MQISIDAELQKAIRGKIEEGTTAVLLDARNGEVLAMATKPSFDPNIFNAGVSAAQWRQWTASRSTPLINKATNGLYAPGSTFKMIVGLAALEAKVCRPGDIVSCPGHLDYGDTRFHCHLRSGHGGMNLRSAIMASCDVYFYEMARRVGMDRIAARFVGMYQGPETIAPGQFRFDAVVEIRDRQTISSAWMDAPAFILQPEIFDLAMNHVM